MPNPILYPPVIAGMADDEQRLEPPHLRIPEPLVDLRPRAGKNEQYGKAEQPNREAE